MLLTFEKTIEKINSGELLHIAGTEGLLRKLPKGNWIGGSTEYFMTEDGGKVSNEMLFVTVLPFAEFKIMSYDSNTIKNVAKDAFDNGFTITVIPFNSEVHQIYAERAPEYQDMFIKNVIGWISGLNLSKSGQTPIAVNGLTCEAYTDMAVVAHICVPDEKTVKIGVFNIFAQDETSPVIEFPKAGFSAVKCLVDGMETVLAEYLAANNIDTKLPLVGDYSGIGVNVSFKAIEGNVVNFYAPVFDNIKYRIAKPITDYASEFNKHLSGFDETGTMFSCNCILNFLYGELEGKSIEQLTGPITFGEIAYQLVNQTLVYVSIQ